MTEKFYIGYEYPCRPKKKMLTLPWFKEVAEKCLECLSWVIAWLVNVGILMAFVCVPVLIANWFFQK